MEQLAKCDLCNSAGPFWVLAKESPQKYPILRNLEISAQMYTTVLCRDCGWIFKPGVLSEYQIAMLYQKHGGQNTEKSPEALYISRSAKVLEFVSRRKNISESIDVLDIGGGTGQVSVAFAHAGHRVQLLDIAETRPLHPNMLVHKGTLSNFRPTQTFDLVILSHVLEHVWSPTRFLEQASDLTSSGGHLYIEVPFELYTPFIKRKLGDPRHVGYFTLHTLVRLIQKARLTPLIMERHLGRYDSRCVMVLRALVMRDAQKERQAMESGWRVGWINTLAAMCHPIQIAHAIATRL